MWENKENSLWKCEKMNEIPYENVNDNLKDNLRKNVRKM